MILKDLDVIEIQKYQMNRYPCLFIDYVDELSAGEYAKGYKMFSYNEWFFPNHFADEPVVPGFILVEMMVQMFLMTFMVYPETKGKKTAFTKINNVVFRGKVVPGKKVDIQSTCYSYKRGVATGKTEASVDGELVCSADFKVAIPDVLQSFKPKKVILDEDN